MLYSKENNGFYDKDINSTIPDDCIEIDHDYYLSLLEGQAKGLKIQTDKKGYPVLVEPVYEEIKYIPIITKRQAMLQLDSIGLYDELIELINQTENKTLKIEFEYSSNFERESPFIIGMAQKFNLSDDQVDELFIEAAKL